MEDPKLLKIQMEHTWTEMLTLGDHLSDYPQHQKEIYGAAGIVKEWMEAIQKKIDTPFKQQIKATN